MLIATDGECSPCMTTVSYLDTIITLIGMPTLAQADTQAVHLRAPPAP